MDKLLVIIVTYNGMKWLDKCLSSVTNSSINANMFIVDNGSTDGTITFIQENFPNATLIISGTNLGFGGANNLGIKYALEHGFDYVYLLNQDAWVEPQTFETLIRVNKCYACYGVLSPLQVNKEKTKFDKNFATCCPDEMLSDAICGVELSKVYDTSFVMAAHWLISRECLKTVGAFSPSFYHYGEDGNYLDRVMYFKKKIGIVPLCKGVHDREFRPITNQNRQYKFYTDNLVLLSNPSIRKKYLRLVSRYLVALFKDYSIINGKYFIKTLCLLVKLSLNLKKSKELCAFIGENTNKY